MILTYISFVVIFNFVYSICPNGTLSYRWWCYKVVDKNATFKEAIIECHQYGGALAQVESKEELDFLGKINTEVNILFVSRAKQKCSKWILDRWYAFGFKL